VPFAWSLSLIEGKAVGELDIFAGFYKNATEQKDRSGPGDNGFFV